MDALLFVLLLLQASVSDLYPHFNPIIFTLIMFSLYYIMYHW